MEKMPFAFAVIVAVMALVATNPGFRSAGSQGGCEISSYEYAKLHAAMDRYTEIATVARNELTQDRVTIAQYNRIMRRVDVIKLKQARQMAAVQQVSR